nr:MFS transporter [Euzebyales bacterium]
VRWLAVYAFLMGAGVAAVNAYLPLYAVEVLGVSVQLAGAVAAIIGFVGILSRVLWGWLTERGGGFVVPLLVMAVGAVVALGLVIAAQLAGTAVLWLAALVFGATAVTWNAVGMLALVTEVDPADAGRASGHVLLGFYGGFVPSPIVFGAIVDATGDYRVAWAGVAAVFVAAALLMSAWRRLPGLGE